MLKISVIVPFYNAEKFLPELFCSFEENDFVVGDEIILVDNGSTDHSREICENYVYLNPNLYKYFFYADKAGSYCARNFGSDFAHGDVLVFTDSDCKPCEDWIKKIRSEIELGVIISGGIQIEIRDNGLWEHFDSIAHLNSEKNAQRDSVATANMSVFKEDFLRIGKFEERFSGGDYEWSLRAVKSGMRIKYLGDAYVLHPSRKTFDEILKKEQRISFGDGNHCRLSGQSKWKLILKYFLRIFKIDTNLRYTKQLHQRKVKLKDLIYFNCKFLKIRIDKLLYATKGFNLEDARVLDIK